MLCGVTAGSDKFGPALGWALNPNAVKRFEPAGLAQCFIAVDVEKFSPPGEHGLSGYKRRLAWLAAQMRGLPCAPDAPGPVLVPGDKEHAAERRSAREGVPLAPSIAAAAVKVGEAAGVARPPALLAAAAAAVPQEPKGKRQQQQQQSRVSRVLAIVALAGVGAYALKKIVGSK